MDEGHFDYKSVSEEKEELDFSRLVSCPKCKKPIPHDATMCLYCGEGVIASDKKTWIIWVGIVLIIVVLFFFLKPA